MSSPDLQTAVIACPHCGTRYQVPHATLGAAGREVQCAQCGKSWHAAATGGDDIIFTSEQEQALDAAFEEVEQRSLPPPPAPAPRDPGHERTLAEIRAAIAPRPAPQSIDPALLTKSRRAFDRRLEKVRRTLPFARFRRSARIGALIVLVVLVGTIFLARLDIVRLFPELAGIYAAIGLPVNVIGLEFEDTKTMMSLRNGKTVMQVTARIRSVATQDVTVPPVLVTLLDADGLILLEWTVVPDAGEMQPGEVMDFSSEINAPPDGAVKVRLSFTNGRGDGPAAAGAA